MRIVICKFCIILCLNTNRYGSIRWMSLFLSDIVWNLLRGHNENHRFAIIEKRLIEHEHILKDHEQKIDFFVRTSLPPVEGIFYDGQIFDTSRRTSDFNSEGPYGNNQSRSWHSSIHSRFLAIESSISWHLFLLEMHSSLSVISLPDFDVDIK